MENEIIELYGNGISMSEISRIIKKSRSYIRGVLLKNNITIRSISDSLKLSLKRHPENHSWRKNTKFVSEPCESFKKILKENEIDFIEEFNDFDRLYSIDIAIPEMKIGFEINGNQHYDAIGNLKDYYRKRSEYLESEGWKIFQIHYSLCFNSDYVIDIYEKSKSDKIFEFSYNDYISRKELKKELKNELKKQKKIKFCKCGKSMHITSNSCRKCSYISIGISARKVKNRPSYDTIIDEVNAIGYAAVGRKYGVSDKSIVKWIKYYEKMDKAS